METQNVYKSKDFQLKKSLPKKSLGLRVLQEPKQKKETFKTKLKSGSKLYFRSSLRQHQHQHQHYFNDEKGMQLFNDQSNRKVFLRYKFCFYFQINKLANL